MYCANCGKEKGDGKYCTNCGYKTQNCSMGIRWFCPQCGVENVRSANTEEQRFCSHCGYEVWHTEHDEMPNMLNSHSVTDMPNQKWNLVSAYISMFKKAAEFNTRSSRSEYWWAFLAHIIVTLILFTLVFTPAIVAVINNYDVLNYPIFTVSPLFIMIYFLVTLIPYIALAIRRLHDSGKSGWFLLLNLIPNFGWFIMMVFFVLDSEAGTNKYGANPKGITQNKNIQPDIRINNTSNELNTPEFLAAQTACSNGVQAAENFPKEETPSNIEEIEVSKEIDTIKCKKCGAVIETGFKFCPNCRKRIQKQSAKKSIIIPVVISILVVYVVISTIYAVTYYRMYKIENKKYDNFIEEYNQLTKENNSLKSRLDLVSTQREELYQKLDNIREKYDIPELPTPGFNYQKKR